MRARRSLIPLIVSVFGSGVLCTLVLTTSPLAQSQPEPASSPTTPPSASTGRDAMGGANAAMQSAVDKLAGKIDGYGGKVGVQVVDVTTGRVLAQHASTVPLNPASNMKLVTAGAALWKHTAHHTYRTGLYARRSGTTVDDIVLRSYGDPSLRATDLWELGNGLRRWGIKRIKGDVLVDQSYFDDAYVPPGFEQQPDEWAYFRAPVSAVALEANTVTLHVAPSRSGEGAWVSFDPVGFVDVAGRVTTGEAGSAQNVTLSLMPKDGRLRAVVGGGIPQDSTRLRITKRVEDPTLFAGYALHAILEEQGFQVGGKVRAGGEKAHRLLVLHGSERLGTLLERLGKDSDNFYAEMIFKGLAGDKKRRGLTSESGAQVVREYLKEIGALDEGTVIRNGSGLFDTNRLTARSLATLLRAAYRDPGMRSEFTNHLAVGGEDGTLRWRFRDKQSRGRVRAKTGTLASVISLSGYVMRSSDEAPVAFSIMVNEVPGKVTGAREAIDACVRSIVRETIKLERK